MEGIKVVNKLTDEKSPNRVLLRSIGCHSNSDDTNNASDAGDNEMQKMMFWFMHATIALGQPEISLVCHKTTIKHCYETCGDDSDLQV